MKEEEFRQHLSEIELRINGNDLRDVFDDLDHLLALGPSDTYCSAAFLLKGLAHRKARQLDKSESAFKDALARARSLYTLDSSYLWSVATSLINLGDVLSSRRKFEEAESVFRESLGICRELAKSDPGAYLPNIAMSLNNLGNVLGPRGKIDESELVFRESLAIFKELSKSEPSVYLPSVALTLNSLGDVLCACGKIEESEAVCRESLVIYRTLVDKEPSPYLAGLAMALNNLGNVLRIRRKTDEAESAYQEAIDIEQKIAQTSMSPLDQKSSVEQAVQVSSRLQEILHEEDSEKAWKTATFTRTACIKALRAEYLADLRVREKVQKLRITIQNLDNQISVNYQEIDYLHAVGQESEDVRKIDRKINSQRTNIKSLIKKRQTVETELKQFVQDSQEVTH